MLQTMRIDGARLFLDLRVVQQIERAEDVRDPPESRGEKRQDVVLVQRGKRHDGIEPAEEDAEEDPRHEGVAPDIGQAVPHVEQAADGGSEQARLALDAFCDCVVGYIGMFTAFLGGVDAICFTGGIGTNDARFRKAVADRLTFLNAKTDESMNVSGYEGRISSFDSGVSLWAFETNEELMVARGCVQVLNA